MAQRVLWEDVRLEDGDDVESFVAGTAGVGEKTGSLELVGGSGVGSEEAARAVEACKGLLKLTLFSLRDLERSLLYLPALARTPLLSPPAALPSSPGCSHRHQHSRDRQEFVQEGENNPTSFHLPTLLPRLPLPSVSAEVTDSLPRPFPTTLPHHLRIPSRRHYP